MSSSDQTYEKIPAPSGSLTTGRLISLSWLKILGLVIFLLLIGRFAVVGWTRISLNANSADGDQPAYLRLGLDIREQGQWTDGKRPPLYPALLSTFASRTWAYFTWAKIVSLTFGLIAIGLIFEIGRRLFNPATGLLAAFLLAINAEFMLHSVSPWPSRCWSCWC